MVELDDERRVDLTSHLSINRHLRLVSSGVLKIRTTRGPVYISNMKVPFGQQLASFWCYLGFNAQTARSSARKIFKVVSHGGRDVVSDGLLKSLFMPAGELEQPLVHTDPRVVQEKSPEELAYRAASLLFDPSGQGRVTEKKFIEAFATVFKEFKFLSTSVNDFGVLQVRWSCKLPMTFF